MLEKLLAADRGYRDPRVPCEQGRQAEFVSYRTRPARAYFLQGARGAAGSWPLALARTMRAAPGVSLRLIRGGLSCPDP